MMRPDLAGLPPEGQAFTRGTPNMWTTASGDEELGLVYLPMGNSAVDYWSGSRRPPENQYATSLVAIDVTTGRPTWHFQTVHKDVWDYDLGSTATLVDVPVRSEEHTSELQSLMRTSYAVFCLKRKKLIENKKNNTQSNISNK